MGFTAAVLTISDKGSRGERAARENFSFIVPAVEHGLEMLLSEGSADCAQQG